MGTDTSNIDDLLVGGRTSPQHPETPENQYLEDNGYDDSQENEEVNESPISLDSPSDSGYKEQKKNSETHEESNNSQENNVDEYGNEKSKPRMYTEEEHRDILNKVVRERVAQFQRNNPQNQQQPQSQQQTNQMAQDFEQHYDPNSNVPWQQQLEGFIENTFNKMSQREVQRQHTQREQQAANEFRDRFAQGMERFSDFVDVVSNQPVTDHMTSALRGIKDPAAFIYAASKNHASELQRISNLQDPYAQIVEMGRLEERMRKKPAATNAPRPVSRTRDDSVIKPKPKQEEGDSIESLIRRSEQQKLAKIKQRRGIR